MDYATFLAKVIKDGIEAAERDYSTSPVKLKGAVAGFKACESMSPWEIGVLLSESRKATLAASGSKAENYWEIRCFELEVEWVANVISAALKIDPLAPITARAYMKVAEILGVAGEALLP